MSHSRNLCLIHHYNHVCYQFGFAITLLFYILGISALGGFAVCFLCLPLNLVVMNRIERLQDRLMVLRDERMKVQYMTYTCIEIQ